ncbi:MAG: hypothetical protein JW801_19475 [Bacteroidales bacterium]|nr:hypothetical protein [Bacteroidales bacterium]
MLKPYLNRKISGKAIYLAIVISFVAAIFALMFILRRYYGFVEVTTLEKKTALQDLVSSALLVSLENPDINSNQKAKEFQLYEEGGETAKVENRNWGVYEIAWARASWKHLSEEKLAMLGNQLNDFERTGLYLCDHGQYLTVAGDSYLSGNCYLPKLGVRKGYINGQSFKYTQTVTGKTDQSSDHLPELSPKLINYIKTELYDKEKIADSLVSRVYLDEIQQSNSFRDLSIRVYSDDELRLDHTILQGNIIIQSGKRIIIDGYAELSQIICIAPIIEVESGFTGDVQLFATDTMIIGDDVELKYPSAAVIMNGNTNKLFAQLGVGSTLEGILLMSDLNIEGQEAFLKISEEAEIFGEVYCSGTVEHLGKIFGSLYCDKLFLQTRQGYYENHLFNAWVDPVGLNTSFVSGILFTNNELNSKPAVIQWLN